MDVLSHALPRVDHVDIPLGTGYVLTLCGFGPSDAPVDLTGLPCELIVTPGDSGPPQTLTLALSGEWVTVPVDDIAFSTATVRFVLRLAESMNLPLEPVLTGTLRSDRSADPYA